MAPRANWKGYLRLSLVSLSNRSLSNIVAERGAGFLTITFRLKV
jgi:non-homologous end joining protein Ku